MSTMEARLTRVLNRGPGPWAVPLYAVGLPGFLTFWTMLAMDGDPRWLVYLCSMAAVFGFGTHLISTVVLLRETPHIRSQQRAKLAKRRGRS